MLLVGLIFFVFLLVLFWSGIVWIVGKIGKAKGQEQKYRNYTRALGVFIAIATILFFVADEIYTKKQFEQLCKKEAGLKIYKKVDKVDSILNSSYHSNVIDEVKRDKTFKFYENIDRNENKYKIKEHHTKKVNNQYLIDYFIVLTERKYLGHGKFKDTLKKESKINFNDYKIDRYSFKGDKIIKEENVQPVSRYMLLETHQILLNKFGLYKTIIFDIQDYSVIAEHIFVANGGGKFSQLLAAPYGDGGVGGCGENNHNDLIKRVFQFN